MTGRIIVGLKLSALVALSGAAQEPAPAREERTTPEAIYRVNVISRTTKAVNYGHRTEPTRIGFKGTVLLPEARGESKVQSRRGSMLIDAKFERVEPPTRFGRAFLTYVVWAISPEGRPENLGELILNGSNKGRLIASTELQAFALIVTAEPYFAVTQPSDVVVMENVVRPDTVGQVTEVNARYELLPRKEFTYDLGAQSQAETRMVSMDEYEVQLALYQAQNAIQIARTAGADVHAAETLHKAEDLHRRALELGRKNRKSRDVVTIARESAQVAEDARAIALKRQTSAAVVEPPVRP